MGKADYLVIVVLFITMVTVRGVEEEKAGQQTVPQYGCNFPYFANNFQSGDDQSKSTNQQPHFMPHPGMYIPQPIYMLPPWPVPAMKGQKGEPGERTEFPKIIITDQNQTPDKDMHFADDHNRDSLSRKGDKGDEGLAGPSGIKGEPGRIVTPDRDEHFDKASLLKGDKGDQGLTGPRGYRGEVGPPGPPGTSASDFHSRAQYIQPHGTQNDSPDGQGLENNAKVAFTVALTKNIGPASEALTLKFEDITTNLGDGYNTTSGEFSAPVSGLYVFTYHILGQHSKPTEVSLKHNNKLVNSVHSRETGGYTGVSNTAILVLDKGDLVILVLSPGIYYVYGETGQHTTFSGYKLHT